MTAQIIPFPSERVAARSPRRFERPAARPMSRPSPRLPVPVSSDPSFAAPMSLAERVENWALIGLAVAFAGLGWWGHVTSILTIF